MMKIRNILLALVIAMSLISCNSKTQSKDENEEHEEHGIEGVVVLNANQRKALDLKLGKMQKRNLTTVVKTNGELSVSPSASADITAVMGGNVKKIMVFQGDEVKKGQVLAVLEHPDYIALQEDFAVVANNLDYLKQEYERQKELYENNVGAGKSYQKAKSEYSTAKAKYQGLKARLELLNISPVKVMRGEISNTINIISPIHGFVNEVYIRVGSYADAKDVLLEIKDNSDIHADFMVYEKDVHLLKIGQKIHFTVSNRPGDEFTAIVFAIGKEFQENTRAVPIHAKINEKVEGLIPGMYITGHLHTDKKHTTALPSDAIVKEGAKSYIFIVDNSAMHEEHEGEEAEHEEDNGDNLGGEAEELHKEDGSMAFRMVEVIQGVKDGGYTEVHLIDSLPENTQIVMNAAYYLLADMNKEETGDDD